MNIKFLARALTGTACLLLAALATPVIASTYSIPQSGNGIIGATEYITAVPGETLVTIARRFDLGLNAILAANPGITSNVPLQPGEHIKVPTSFILPPLAHHGIIVNLPEMRMYYYFADGVVKTYPIGIGKIGKTIPIERTAITRKVVNPIWIPPADIIAFNEEQGIKLPRIMQAGPDNPLGPYAIYLKIPTYLIHSTIYPESIGRRASFGCIRMHENDIKDFFPLVTPGTPVVIVDMPSKVGWQGNLLYLESHAPLEERSGELGATYPGMINEVETASTDRPAFVDWQLVSTLSVNRDGMPHDIGFKL